ASIQHRKKRSYYHCPNQKVKHTNFGQHMLVAEMDEMFSDLFKNMSLPREIIERTIAKAKEVFRRSHGDLDTKIRELSVHKTRLEDRRNELEVKLLDKVVTDDTYRRQSTDLNNQIRDIDTELAKLQSAKTGNMLEFEQLLKMADNIYAAFQEAPYELKRKYFGLFWEKLTVQDKKIKEAVPSKLFRAVLPLSFATLKTRKPIKENIPVQLVSSSQGWLPG
ncbi:hypothetical protein KGQ71_04185, partial [Patescibacteria group bacterium]|nr:hypothetical protein [Patescibacteria group bacterium]